MQTHLERGVGKPAGLDAAVPQAPLQLDHVAKKKVESQEHVPGGTRSDSERARVFPFATNTNVPVYRLLHRASHWCPWTSKRKEPKPENCWEKKGILTPAKEGQRVSEAPVQPLLGVIRCPPSAGQRAQGLTGLAGTPAGSLAAACDPGWLMSCVRRWGCPLLPHSIALPGPFPAGLVSGAI